VTECTEGKQRYVICVCGKTVRNPVEFRSSYYWIWL